jgi:hypothetical protein
MSMEELEQDLERNIADLENTAFLSAEDVRKYLRETLWPFMTNLVAETTEIDDCVANMVEDSDDVLQRDTASLFAAVIVSCQKMMDELVKRLTKTPEDQIVRNAIAQVRPICLQAAGKLEEITVDEEEEDDEESANDAAGGEA